jgi:hypothetical protein
VRLDQLDAVVPADVARVGFGLQQARHDVDAPDGDGRRLVLRADRLLLSQPRPVAHRDHRDERPSRHLRLRRAAHQEGLSKKEIIRCLKRYVAREVYPYLRPGA